MAQPDDLSTRIARVRALSTQSKNRDQVLPELTSLVDAMERELSSHELRIKELEKLVYAMQKRS